MRLMNQQQAGEVLSLSDLIIEDEMCINLRGRMLHCSACSDTCPSQALTLTVDGIQLDKEKCTSCNSCLPSCAAGALRSSGFIPSRFLATLKDKQEIHLHCRNSKGKGGGVVIPCHNVLDARLLASIRADGFSDLKIHGLDQCGECDLGDARAHIKNTIEITRSWMGENAATLDLTPQQDDAKTKAREFQDQAHLDRRSFLRFGGAKTVNHVVEWFVPALMQDEEDEEELLPFYQASEFPQRAAAYLAPLIQRIEQVPWVSETSLPWQLRTVNEDCSGCLSCGERCPTGALNAEETTNSRNLSFDPALCTDCKLCEKICPENAISVSSANSVKEVLTGSVLIMHMGQNSCKQCGGAFIPEHTDEDICPICCNERDLDEEWMGMLSE